MGRDMEKLRGVFDYVWKRKGGIAVIILIIAAIVYGVYGFNSLGSRDLAEAEQRSVEAANAEAVGRAGVIAASRKTESGADDFGKLLGALDQQYSDLEARVSGARAELQESYAAAAESIHEYTARIAENSVRIQRAEEQLQEVAETLASVKANNERAIELARKLYTDGGRYEASE